MNGIYSIIWIEINVSTSNLKFRTAKQRSKELIVTAESSKHISNRSGKRHANIIDD